MSASVIRAHAASLPLPDGSVDLIVTSPPYFGLRSYTDGGEHYPGQIGSEATPGEWLDALWACTREWVRVLKPEGSLFVNLGDKYAGVGGSNGHGWCIESDSTRERRAKVRVPLHKGRTSIAPSKSLMGLPWRYAIGCMDRLGLILRAEIVWAKPNGLPESVTDRVRRSHEQIFHMVKQPRYYSAVDEIREPHALTTHARARYGHQQEWAAPYLGVDKSRTGLDAVPPNPLGKLPSSVWEIDEGPSPLRSVLSAIHTGSLTIDEGERILTGAAWTGSSGSGRMWISPATAGSGPAASHLRDTASSGSTERPSVPTAPPTPSPTGSFPTAASTSTTSAASPDASGPSTSNPSPSAKTSYAAQPPKQPSTPPKPTANTGTSSPTPTPTGQQTGSACAANAYGQATAEPTGGSEVWWIPSQPLVVPESLGVSHFAAFPMELPRRVILGWSPPGVCTACGQGRRPVVDKRLEGIWHDKPLQNSRYHGTNGQHQHNRMGQERAFGSTAATITGYACACPQPTAPTRPAIVLDPFCGTGTTMLVASVLGRHGIGADLSADYCRLARWRTRDRGEIAKALQVPKPPPQVGGQDALFEVSP